MASGGGSNLQSILDYFDGGPGAAAGVRVALVMSDRAQCGALDRARARGIETRVIRNDGTEPEEEVVRAMQNALDAGDIDLIALAGYVRLVPASIVRRYEGALLNIHPALLPAFGGQGMYGRRVHEAVLAAGARVSGATVHFVDEAYDRGRIIAQWPVPVFESDSADTLAGRVLRIEHLLYPAAIEAV